MGTDLPKRPAAKPPSERRPSGASGPTPAERAPAKENGAGFAWILAPHPGRIRAMAIGGGGTLGRSEDADIRIDGPGVAPIHAKVDLVARMPGVPSEIYVTDAGTTSGTYVSGMRAQRTVLHDGDLLRVGGAIALVVESDIGSYDGSVIDERGIVRGARSRRGWFAAVEAAGALPADVRRAALVSGPPGCGRTAIVRRLAEKWGTVLSEGTAEERPEWEIDVAAAKDEAALKSAIVRATQLGAVVLEAPERAARSLQLACAASLADVPQDVPIFLVLDDAERSSELPAELESFAGTTRIEIPSIEQRREELPTLVRYWFERRGVSPNRLSIELYEALTRAAWAGEIKELVETVERIAATHSDVPRLGPEHLVRPLSRRGGRIAVSGSTPPQGGTEADKIRAALAEAKGSVAAAARALHLSRQALYREAARLGVDIRRARDEGSAA